MIGFSDIIIYDHTAVLHGVGPDASVRCCRYKLLSPTEKIGVFVQIIYE